MMIRNTEIFDIFSGALLKYFEEHFPVAVLPYFEDFYHVVRLANLKSDMDEKRKDIEYEQNLKIIFNELGKVFNDANYSDEERRNKINKNLDDKERELSKQLLDMTIEKENHKIIFSQSLEFLLG